MRIFDADVPRDGQPRPLPRRQPRRTWRIEPRPMFPRALRWMWRIGGVAWVVLLVPFGTLQAASVLAHEVETVVTSYPAAGLTTVDIGNDNGSVVVVGTDAPDVSVTARIDHGWKRTGNVQQVEGGTLGIHSSCPSLFSGFCGVKYTIEMPRGLALEVHSDNGSVTVSDLTGAVTLTTDNGRVAAARLDGDLVLRTSNGKITGHELRSPGVEADSDNGRVELGFTTAPRAVTAITNNGSVEVVVPADSGAYRVDAGSNNGSVAVGVDRLADSKRTVTAQSDNGSVRVDYAR